MNTATEQAGAPGSRRRTWVPLAIAVGLVLVITQSCEPRRKPTTEEIASSASSAATASATAERIISSSTRSAPSPPKQVDALPWLESQFGMPPSQAATEYPGVWYGYVSGAYVDKGNLHVQLQVDRKADEKLGQEAAKALANFVGFSDDPVVAGVDWAIAEDGTGVIIKQEKVPEL